MDGFLAFISRIARNSGTEYTCPLRNCGAIFRTEDEMNRHLRRIELFGGHKSQMRHIYNNLNAALIRVQDIGPGTSDMGECIEQSDQEPPEVTNLFNGKSSFQELSEFAEIAEQAKRRAEVARLKELRTLKGQVESFARLRGLDIDMMQQHYTV